MNIRFFMCGFALFIVCSSCVTTGGYMDSSFTHQVSQSGSNYYHESSFNYFSSGSYDNSFHFSTK